MLILKNIEKLAVDANPMLSAVIGAKDPDDIHLLALALKLACPVWTNDKDFEGVGV